MDTLARPVARGMDIERPSLSAYVVNGEFVGIVAIPVDRLPFRHGSTTDSAQRRASRQLCPRKADMQGAKLCAVNIHGVQNRLKHR